MPKPNSQKAVDSRTLPGEGFYWVRVKDQWKHKCTYVCCGWTVGLQCDGHWELIGATKHFSDETLDEVGPMLNYTLNPPSFGGYNAEA